MRNLKKFLALVLAMLMVVSAAATVSAFEDVAEDNAFAAAIAELNELGIVTGMTEEEFGIDTNVQRIHAAIMFARALTGEVGSNDVWNQGLSQFADVTEYQYAVTVAVKAGIINGVANPDGTITFNPKDNITYIQALKMAVCALGLGDGLAWGTDGIAYYNVADAYGLTAGVNYITDPAKALTRGEFAQIIANMINAEYVEDGVVTTLLKKVFDIPADPEVVEPEEVTNFIITATDEQTAYTDMLVNDAKWVGMQEIANGVTVGEIVYFPVADLGLAEGEDVEDYFLHVFDVVNFDAETEEYASIAPNAQADSWMILASEISAHNTTYDFFTYNGEKYYAADVQTDSKIKQEVVIYSTTDFASDEGKELYMNSKDQVLHPTENVPVLEKVVSSRGNVRYRLLIDDVTVNGTTYEKGDYLTYEEAVAAYGYKTGEEATLAPFSILEVDNLKSNDYALIAFDDDGDGAMDRAYCTPVYMDVVAEKLENTDGDGPISKDTTFVDGKTYAKDTVIVYTYNKQLDEINVLTSSEKISGVVVDSINTRYKNNKDKGYYSTITLEDGTVYTLKNEKYFNVAKTFGATVAADVSFVNDDVILEAFRQGSKIDLVVIDGIIYNANLSKATTPATPAYDLVILDEVTNADIDAVEVEVYNEKGDLETLWVSFIDYKGEKIEIAKISWIKLGTILNDIADAKYEDKIYRLYGNEADGYYLNNKVDLLSAEKASDFGLIEIPTEDVPALIIEDNVVTNDYYTNLTRLRTTEDTVWYFIDTTTGKVASFAGELEYATIKLTANTRIFADKLGFGGANRGEAAIVYVVNSGLRYGFNALETTQSIVYVSNIDEEEWNVYDMGSAKYFGLDTAKYTAKTYFQYEDKYAVDMYTGENVTLYSADELKKESFYLVDENNVVIAAYDNEADKDPAYAKLVADANGNKKVTDNDLILNIELYTYEFVLDDEYYAIYDEKDDGSYIVDPSWDIKEFVVVRHDSVKKTVIDNTLDIYEKINEEKFVKDLNKNTGLDENMANPAPVNAYVLASALLNDARALYAEDAYRYFDADGKYVVITGGAVVVPEEEEEEEEVTNPNEKTIDFNATCAWGNETYVANFTNKDSKRIDGVITSVLEPVADLEWGATVTADIDPFQGEYQVTAIKLGTADKEVGNYDIEVENNTDGTLSLKMSTKVNTPFDSKDLAAGNYTITLKKADAVTVTIYVKIA